MAAELDRPLLHISSLIPQDVSLNELSTRAIYDIVDPISGCLNSIRHSAGGCRFLAVPRLSLAETASLTELAPDDASAHAAALAGAAVNHIISACLQVSRVSVADDTGGSSSGRSKKSPKGSARAGSKSKKAPKSKAKTTTDSAAEASTTKLRALIDTEPWGTPDVFIVFGNYPMSTTEHAALMQAMAAAEWPTVKAGTNESELTPDTFQYVPPTIPAKVLSSTVLLQRDPAAVRFPLPSDDSAEAASRASPRSGRKSPKSKKGKSPQADAEAAAVELASHLAALGTGSLCSRGALAEAIGGGQHCVMPILVDAPSPPDAVLPVLLPPGDVAAAVASALYALVRDTKAYAHWIEHTDVQELLPPLPLSGSAQQWQRLSEPLHQMYMQECATLQGAPGGGALLQTPAGVLHAMVQAVAAVGVVEPRASPRIVPTLASVGGIALPASPREGTLLSRGEAAPAAVTAVDAPWGDMDAVWGSAAHGSLATTASAEGAGSVLPPLDSSAACARLGGMGHPRSMHAPQAAVNVFLPVLNALLPTDIASGAISATEAYDASATLAERETLMLHAGMAPGGDAARVALERQDILQAAAAAVNKVEASSTAVEFGYATALTDLPAAGAPASQEEPHDDGDSYDGAAGLDMLAGTQSGRDSPVPDDFQGDAVSAGAASPTPHGGASPPLAPSTVSLGSLLFEPVDSMGQQFSSLHLGAGGLQGAGGFDGAAVVTSMPSSDITAGDCLPPLAAKLAHTWDLTDRRHTLNMTAGELAQRVLGALSGTPGSAAFTTRLPSHGAAVLAVHTATPRRRQRVHLMTVQQSLEGTCVLPSFAEWRREVLPSLVLPLPPSQETPSSADEAASAQGDEGWEPISRPGSPPDGDIPRCALDRAVQLSASELNASVAAAVRVLPRSKHEASEGHRAAAAEAEKRVRGLAGRHVEQLFPSDGSVVSVSSVGAALVLAPQDAPDKVVPEGDAAWCWGVKGRSLHIALPDGPSLRVSPSEPSALRKLRMDDAGREVQHKPFSTGRCCAVLDMPGAGEALHVGMAESSQLLFSSLPASLAPGWHMCAEGAYKLAAWADRAGDTLHEPPTQSQLHAAAAKITTLKPDGHGTVESCVRCGSLEVTVSSAGQARQAHTQPRVAWPEWSAESKRTHDSFTGEVVRTLMASTPQAGGGSIDNFELQHSLRADGSSSWRIPAGLLGNDYLPASANKCIINFADGRRTVSWEGVLVSSLSSIEYGAGATVLQEASKETSLSVEQAISQLPTDSIVSVQWSIAPVDVMSTLDAASGAVVSVRYEASPVSDPAALEAALVAQVAASRVAARPTPVFKKARDVMLLGELSTALEREHDAERLSAAGGPWSGASTSSAHTEAKTQESLDTPLGRLHAMQLWGHPHLAPLVADVEAHPLPHATQQLIPVGADGDVFGATGQWEGIGSLGKVVTVHYPDGTVLAHHCDGTSIVVEAAVAPADAEGSALPQQHVTVACPGMATVESDRFLHEAFSKHADGQPVSIVSTGVQTRLVVACPDDTLIAADYDCSVTALWNGRVRVHTADGRVVLLQDGGAMQYRGPQADRSEGVLGPGIAQAHADSDDDDDETAAMAAPSPRGAAVGVARMSPLALGGLQESKGGSNAPTTPRDHDINVLHIELETGELQVRDANANVFSVSKRGECTAELAGAIQAGDGSTLYPDLVNPRPPRLFVARADGSAYELLTGEEWGALTRRAKHAFDVAAHLAHGLAGEAPSELLAGLPSGSASRGPVGTALTSGRQQTPLQSAPIPSGRGAAARQDPTALPPPAVEGAVTSTHIPSELAAPTALPSQHAAPPVPPPGAAGGDTPLAQAMHGIVQYTFVQRRHSSAAGSGALRSIGVVHNGSRMQVRACTRGWIQPTDAFVQGMLRRNRPQRTDVFGAAAMPAPAVFEARSDATAVAQLHQTHREGMFAATGASGGTTGFLGASTLGSTVASGMQLSSSSSRSRCVALMPELVSAPAAGVPALHCSGSAFSVTVFPALGQSWLQAIHAADTNVAAWRNKVLQEKYQFKVHDDRPQDAVASELELARAALRLRALSRARAKKLRKAERRSRKATRRARNESGGPDSPPMLHSALSPGSSPGGHSGFGTPHSAAAGGFNFQDDVSADGSDSGSDENVSAAVSMHDSPGKAPPNPGLELHLAPEGLGGTAGRLMPVGAKLHMRSKAVKYA